MALPPLPPHSPELAAFMAECEREREEERRNEGRVLFYGPILPAGFVAILPDSEKSKPPRPRPKVKPKPLTWLTAQEKADVVARVRSGESLATVARHFGTQARTIGRVVERQEKAEAKRNFARGSESAPRLLDETDWIELLEALRVRPRWHRDSACKDHSELSWFTKPGEPVAAQKAICSACLVRQECADAGADDLFGLWGGLSGQQRRNARRLQVTAA